MTDVKVRFERVQFIHTHKRENTAVNNVKCWEVLVKVLDFNVSLRYFLLVMNFDNPVCPSG